MNRVLGVVTLAAAAAGLPFSGTVQAGERARLTARIDAPRETAFVLRVVTAGISGYPELIHEEEVSPGPVRVSFPCPQVPYLVTLTSPHHQPVIRAFRAGQAVPRFRKTIRPVPWIEGHARVLRDGRPVAGAEVRVLIRAKDLEGKPVLPWLEQRTITSGSGLASVHGTDGAWLGLEVRQGDVAVLRWLSPDRLLEGVLPVHLDPPHDSLVIELRTPPDIDPAAATVFRRAGPAAAWSALEPWSTGPVWYGPWPGGVAIRVEVPGCRPVEIHDVARDPPGWRRLGVDLERAGNPGGGGGARIFVRVAGLRSARGHGPAWCGTCGWKPPAPARVEARRIGAGSRWITVWREGSSRPRHDAGGLPPGRYEIRVRGPLGSPHRFTLALPPGTNVRASVSVAGGSAIRLGVREGPGRWPRTVSFRVTDADGRPRTVEVTSPDLRNRIPAWSREGTAFDSVPNGGLIRLEPGEHRVEVRRRDGMIRVFAVRTYPDTITRLEASIGDRRPPRVD